MKVRALMFVAALSLTLAAAGASAQQTGSVFGKVVDTTGGVVPGVTVTLTGGSLLQPQTALTSETGTYRFAQLPIGTYTVKFDLTGFKTVVREGILVEIGFNANVNATMEMSTVQEVVTVSGASPVVDLRDTTKTNRFTQDVLQNIPSARDPWVILEQSAGIVMDRQNVGGNMSGQQSNFVARGANSNQTKWNLDGIDITDMSATGGSPVYYDFDAFEEMQITTGGSDVTMQTPGVGINLVTKSGTDRFKGSGRFYETNDKFQSINITDALRTQGATSGSPIQDIKDYGLEVGGPVKKGRAWFWGAYGKQLVDVGVNNFYQPTTTCQQLKKDLAADPLSHSIQDTWNCLNTDETLLENYNAKLSVQPFRNNQVSFFMNSSGKVRNARGADDLHPIETTSRQMGVNPDLGLGSKWWKTGPSKTYKWSDRQVFTDRFLMEFQFSHVGNNFVLDFHEDDLANVQPAHDISSTMNGRSSSRSIYVRPTDSIDVTGNYFWPGFLGGDHSLKFGGKYRNDIAHSESHRGGNATARFDKFAGVGVFYSPNCNTVTSGGVPTSKCEADMSRDGISEYQLRNRNLYVQDSYSRKKLTVNVGFRFDYQTDSANPETVPQNPFYGQTTWAGTFYNPSDKKTYTLTGAAFGQLPSITFAGAKAMLDRGYGYRNWSPRLGFTYDLTGNGRNVVKVNYAHYVSQSGTGDLSSTYNPVGTTTVRYPWMDLNGDGVIQAKEIVMLPVPLSNSSGYDYNNPSALKTTGRNDPNIRMETTDEAIFSFDRQIASDFAVGASFIYRRYNGARTSYTTDSTYAWDVWTSANYTAVQWAPDASVCPTGAQCPSITYYQPTSQPPVNYIYTDQRGYSRKYKGFELTARKRMSKRWMMNGSFSYSDTPQFYGPGSYRDPTNIDKLNGGQYAPQTSGSGIDNVFMNARWLARVSGSYQLPWQEIGVAAFYNSHDGYVFPQYLQTPSRPFSAGRASVYVFRYGSVRLPRFQTVDFRLDKMVRVGRVRFAASMDAFNLFNSATVLSKRRLQNASDLSANKISSILAPRVLRFGVRVTF